MLHRGGARLTVSSMCRSSVQSIGFLLLLWIGIVIPSMERQMAAFAADAASEASLDVGAPSVSQHHDGNALQQSGTPDLPDILAAGLPTCTDIGFHPSEPAYVSRMSSRVLPPRDRPPIAAIA